MRLDYTYGSTSNNGNVLTQTITAGSSVMTDTFTYDMVNRLSSATESGAASWQQNYGYDRFGNRWYSSGNYLPNPTLTPQSQAAFNQSTNRLSASQYDNAGNQTLDAASGQYGYDAADSVNDLRHKPELKKVYGRGRSGALGAWAPRARSVSAG